MSSDPARAIGAGAGAGAAVDAAAAAAPPPAGATGAGCLRMESTSGDTCIQKSAHTMNPMLLVSMALASRATSPTSDAMGSPISVNTAPSLSRCRGWPDEGGQSEVLKWY